MTTFKVNFQRTENGAYCANIVTAENREAIEKHFEGCNWLFIAEATDADTREAERKGMPFYTIEPEFYTDEEMTEEEAEEKADLLEAAALEMLMDDDELFVDMCEELDAWNGFLDDNRCYSMYELDELHCGKTLSEFLEELTPDFNIRDEYFFYSVYGLGSCDSRAEHYHDNVWEKDLLDNLIEESARLDFWGHDDFKEIVEEIAELRGF